MRTSQSEILWVGWEHTDSRQSWPPTIGQHPRSVKPSFSANLPGSFPLRSLFTPSFEGSLEGCSSLCALRVSSFLFASRNVAALTHGVVTTGSSTKLVWYTRCVALR